MTDTPAPESPKKCALTVVLGYECQFPNEPAAFNFAGRNWCYFHLPLEDDSKNPSQKAGWKVDDIEWVIFENKTYNLLGNAKPKTKSSDGRANFRFTIFPAAMAEQRPALAGHSSMDGKF